MTEHPETTESISKQKAEWSGRVREYLVSKNKAQIEAKEKYESEIRAEREKLQQTKQRIMTTTRFKPPDFIKASETSEEYVILIFLCKKIKIFI